MTLRSVLSLRVMLLLLSNLFSTVTFAVFYASLELFLTHERAFSESKAATIMGVFLALNYAFSLVGGYIGGRWLSYRMLFFIATFLQTVASIALLQPSLSHLYLFSILSVFVVCTGSATPCISMILTQYFKTDDIAREKVFMWNYAFINAGFTIGFSMSGLYQTSFDFHAMFIVCVVANIVSLIVFALNFHRVRDITTPLTRAVKNNASMLIIFAKGIVGCLLLFMGAILADALILNAKAVQSLLVILPIIMLIFFLAAATRHAKTAEGRRLIAFILLAFANLVFWSVYQLMPTGMVFFITNDVNLHIGHFIVSPQYFNLINSLVVVVGGFGFPVLFRKLRERRVVDLPIQFSSALAAMAIGLFILVFAIVSGNQLHGIWMGWVALSYIIQSVAEVLIAPIGRSMIGLLGSERFAGIMMGTWMMLSGVAAVIAGQFSSLMALEHEHSIAAANIGYLMLFAVLGVIALFCAVLLYGYRGFFRRLIGQCSG